MNLTEIKQEVNALMDAIDRLFSEKSELIALKVWPSKAGFDISFRSTPSEATWDPVQRLLDSNHFVLGELSRRDIKKGIYTDISICKKGNIGAEEAVTALKEFYGDRAVIKSFDIQYD